MTRTKVTARRNNGPKVFVPRPQGGPNIREPRAGDNHGKEN